MLGVRRGARPRRSSVQRGRDGPLRARQRTGVHRKGSCRYGPDRRRWHEAAGGAGCGPRRCRPAWTWRRPRGAARADRRRRRPPTAVPAGPGSRWSAAPGRCGVHGSGGSGRQLHPALVATILHDRPTGPGGHAGPETVVLGPLADVGLKGALHWFLLRTGPEWSDQCRRRHGKRSKPGPNRTKAVVCERPTTLRPRRVDGQSRRPPD